ncbi:cell division protein FtsI [Aphanothece hegewaldii CCALA 016]|uniref:Cell division protein FtsI n=1 Tax=Aphanothece hegewaldii CCALA 016 TaxID=2107694 RepID=A0A2T1LX13_9CHRO|nr:penicillin-binding protein 2 [Aphanothece hegewaldii]PSF36730.1 cell division protein FtsI [Aphanothece hegewaldii CCALA 016]
MTDTSRKLISHSSKGRVNKKRPQKPNSRTKATHFKAKPSQSSIFRLIMVWAFLLAGMFGLGWRLYQLQIVQFTSLHSKARQQQTVSLRPYIPRRSIIDRQGNILATDQLIHSLYVHPKYFQQSNEEVAQKLAPLLKVNPQKLVEQFSRQETGIRLAKNLDESDTSKIKALKLDGVDLLENYARFYPQNDLAADVLGYVDQERQGQAGLELSQRKLLERDLYSFSTRRNGEGVILPAFLPKEVFNFDELQLQLTLDTRLQRAARAALKRQLQKFKAKRGAVLVMDAKDGSLLSLVSEPSYNPNEYYKSNVSLFKNWTVSDLYEPGSTFKPLNVAIAIEEGVITPTTIINDTGLITVDRWPIKNATQKANGKLDIAGVLQTSSNVAMVQIMQRLNRKVYYQRLAALGLDQGVGIDLPGEVSGHLKTEEEFTRQAIEAATASFGQGFSLTPIKLVQLHAALANGGKLVTPHIVRGLVDEYGQIHWQPTHTKQTIFTPQTTQKVIEMMETVVSDGTGEVAKIDKYRIAGKTGTAQKASPRGGYLANAKITSFVAILPVESPRYVILAVVDEPKGANTFGSTVAAPIVKSVMEALISIQGIPPFQVKPREGVKERIQQ